jgi:peptidoglycan/xylan/chitin deacetylase (PgdA/CDA1 family)
MKKNIDFQTFIGSISLVLLLSLGFKIARIIDDSIHLLPPGLTAISQSDTMAQPLEYYRVSFGKIKNPREGQAFTLRHFQMDHKGYYLTLNPQTLKTAIIPNEKVERDSLTIEQFRQQTASFPYGKALHDDASNDQLLQDAGLVHTDIKANGVNLTIDLCPSQRPLTRKLFTQLIAVFAPEELPVPITIAITAVWMQQHPSDLGWLLGLVRSGKLDITWVNHTYHHQYDPKLPLPENFLLEKNTNLDAEVLGNEQAMLEHGLLPSPFFRFPGLVSNRAVFDIITDYGLLPLGSDAWLAKGQKPTQGSIVLVHGNGNEPVGITDFLKLLAKKSPLIRQKKWLLLDLDSSLVAKEQH